MDDRIERMILTARPKVGLWMHAIAKPGFLASEICILQSHRAERAQTYSQSTNTVNKRRPQKSCENDYDCPSNGANNATSLIRVQRSTPSKSRQESPQILKTCLRGHQRCEHPLRHYGRVESLQSQAVDQYDVSVLSDITEKELKRFHRK